MILAARSNMESLSFQMGCSLVSFGLSDPGRFRLSDRSASASPVRASSDTGFRTTASATQSPWRLPSAGFAGVDPPSLVPQDLPFLTACAALVFTPHASPMLVAPLVPMACAFGYRCLLWASCSCWTKRMSRRYTPLSPFLSVHGGACLPPIYVPCRTAIRPAYVRRSFDMYRWRLLSMTDIHRGRSAPHPPGATGPSSPGR